MNKFLAILVVLAVAVSAPAAFAQKSASGPFGHFRDEWAAAKYQTPSKDAKIARIEKLESESAAYLKTHPDDAQAQLWHGIILSTHAGFVRSMSVLSKVEEAKTLFEESIKKDPRLEGGMAYTFLGTLYHQAPGWPISFGDDSMAEKYFKLALEANPRSIDANYFYAEFLADDGKFSEAKTYYERAIATEDRPGWAAADDGRRAEAKAGLKNIAGKVERTQSKRNFN